jgi:membrane protein YqaA with SNARE-associated domain
MKSSWRQNALAILGIAFGLGIGIFAVTFRGEIDRRIADVQGVAALGYGLGFALNLLSSGSLFLPVPGWATVFTMGSFLHPVGLGLCAGIGAGIGETTGYLAGLWGQSMLQSSRLYERIHAWTLTYGMATVCLMAAAPNPLFDLGGIAAGATGMPYRKFLLAACVGKTVRFIGLALSRQWV